MKSKTSFCKTALIRKNAARFWPAWALYLVVLFFILTLPVYYLTDEVPASKIETVLNHLNVAYHPVLVFVFALLIALLHFSYLYSPRTCNMMHAFPLSRKQLYASHYISGILFLVLPQIFIFLISYPGIRHSGIPFTAAAMFLFTAFAYSFIFFSIAVFCCMLAGHPLSAFVYFLIFNSVFVIVRALFVGIQNVCGYGLNGDIMAGLIGMKGNFLSPIVYITRNCGVDYQKYADQVCLSSGDKLLSSIEYSDGKSLLLYCLAAIVILAAAMFLYKKRNLERAGDMSAFLALNPIIRWIVAVCCGILTGYLVTALLFNTDYLSDIFGAFIILTGLFTFVWFFITEMVLKKRFRVFQKRFWAEWGVLCAITLCLLGALKADAFHVVNHVPAADDVKAVDVTANYQIVTDDPAGIAKAITLQKTILSHQKEYADLERQTRLVVSDADTDETAKKTDDLPVMQSVQITYYLKDDSTIARDYQIPVTEESIRQSDSAISVLTTLETPESALQEMLGLDYEKFSVKRGSFIQPYPNAEAALTGKQAAALYDALLKDIKDGNIHYQTKDVLSLGSTPYERYSSSYTYITLEGEQPGAFRYPGSIIGTDFPVYGTNHDITPPNTDSVQLANGSLKTEVSVPMYLNSNCKHTCAVLKELGLIEQASDIDKINKSYYDYDMELLQDYGD